MLLNEPLTERRSTIAGEVVARLYNERPHLVDRYGPGGRAKCVEDTEHTLQALADALWSGEQGVFLDYIGWAMATMTGHGVDAQDVSRSLELLAEVLPTHGPWDLARAYVGAALEGLPALLSAPACELCEGEPLGALARRVLDALLAGERMTAERLVCAEAARGTDLRDLYLGVVAPVQREVGRLWQTGQITVAREHFCTNAITALMSRLAMDVLYRDRPRRGLTLLAASVEGERHEVGIRTVADLFECEGWTVYLCGASTPLKSIATEVERLRPRVVALSATMTWHLRRVADVIRAVRATAGWRQARILVGGRAFRAAPGLAERIGADACPADAAGALEAVKDIRGVYE